MTVKLTGPQESMLSEVRQHGVFEVCQIWEISTAKALARKGLGTLDSRTWTFVPVDQVKETAT